MNRVRRCAGIAVIAAFFVLLGACSAHAEDYSEAISLEVLRPERQDETPSASAVQPSAYQAGTVEGRFVYTVMEYGISEGDGYVFRDVALSAPFPLRVDEAGGVFLDVSSGQTPYVTVLDADCMEPDGQRVLSCDTRAPEQWGWRDAFMDWNPDEAALYDHMALGGIDAATGRLEGLVATPGSTVYLAYREPVIRYRVFYYDLEGVLLSDGTEYALRGSDLGAKPSGVHFPVPPGEALGGFVLLGTETPAPSFAEGVAHLQMRLAAKHEVSFLLDGEPFGVAQWVPDGGVVDFAALSSIPDTDERAHDGWSPQGEAGRFDPLTPVRSDLVLCAAFVRMHAVRFYAHADDEQPMAEIRVRHGGTLDPASVGAPQGNLPFLGWMGPAGTMLDAETVITGDVRLVAAYGTLAAKASYRLRGEVVGVSGASVEWSNTYGGEPLYYDAGLDAYYLELTAIPETARIDLFHNDFSLYRSPDMWSWQYAPDGEAHALLEMDGRWYLDGFSYSLLRQDAVLLTYGGSVTLYEVAFLDADGGALAQTFPVLAGGSLTTLDGQQNILAMLPAEKREALEGWDVEGGARADYPLAIAAPITLRARYRALHEVAFFLHDPLDMPYATQMV
ncbi:hypothetical protein LJC74_09815, partial [Eubacteriales bacterium OttesenSCG-928-A19]|nr:hypothetical protein [Eubacteriales bacterium OttesenSCG-928-A19]